jgi:hypothetical protein
VVLYDQWRNKFHVIVFELIGQIDVVISASKTQLMAEVGVCSMIRCQVQDLIHSQIRLALRSFTINLMSFIEWDFEAASLSLVISLCEADIKLSKAPFVGRIWQLIMFCKHFEQAV